MNRTDNRRSAGYTWVPGNFVKYCNTLSNNCPRCKEAIMNAKHLEQVHQLQVLDPLILYEEILKIRKIDQSRDKALEEAETFVLEHLRKVQSIFS
jgi:hypothetical protein